MTILVENKLGVQLTGKEMKEVKKMVTGYKKRGVIVPALLNAKFTIDSEGLTVTVAHNDYILNIYFEVETEGKGSFLVPIEVIQRLKGIKNDDTFSISSIEDNKKIELISNGTKRVFITEYVDNYPALSKSRYDYVSSIDHDDILKLNDAAISVSFMESRPILQYVLIRDEHIYSTDSHRLYASKTNIKHDSDITVFYAGIKYLKSLFDKKQDTKLFVNDTHVKFNQGKSSIILRQGEGNYPDVKRLIPDHSTTSFAINDKKALTDIIKDAATVTASERNNVIKFKITKNELIITSKNEKKGEFEAITPIHNMQGEELKLMMSGKYVLEGLKQLHSDSIELRFNGHMRPFTMNSDNNENEFALILPVRMF